MKLHDWQNQVAAERNGEFDKARKANPEGYERGCKKKRKYSVIEAEQRLVEVFGVRGERLNAYHCVFCGSYHIGNTPATMKDYWERERVRGAERRIYLTQIKRLQEQNKELVAILCHERRLRIDAYKWYQARLHSWFWRWIDLITMLSKR